MNLDFFSQLNIKKILLIILFLAVCFGLGFGIYFLFFRTTSTTPGQEIYNLPSGELPKTGEGFDAEVVCVGDDCGDLPVSEDLEFLSETDLQKTPDQIAQGRQTISFPFFENKVLSPTLSADGNGIAFYNSEDNKFYTISEATGEPVLLSDQEFFNVENIFWSKDKTKAIISYPDASKILYDFAKQKQTTLSKEINEPEFSNQDQVAYKYLSDDKENNWLAVTDPKGGQTELIESLGANADFVQISWSPNNEVVALYSKPIGLDKSEIFFIGLQGENNKSLIVDGSNFKGIWSVTGNKILYQIVNARNNYNPELWIVDARQDILGQHKFNLKLSTWVDKCVFQSETKVFCAVPKELQEGTGLYPELITQTNDLIYEIDLTTGFNKLIADPVLNEENNFSISQIYLSKNNKYLFFYDNLTQKIYKIQLK